MNLFVRQTGSKNQGGQIARWAPEAARVTNHTPDTGGREGNKSHPGAGGREGNKSHPDAGGCEGNKSHPLGRLSVAFAEENSLWISRRKIRGVFREGKPTVILQKNYGKPT